LKHTMLEWSQMIFCASYYIIKNKV
jgi:hypothetical protein